MDGENAFGVVLIGMVLVWLAMVGFVAFVIWSVLAHFGIV
jgi:hypothetical protein